MPGFEIIPHNSAAFSASCVMCAAERDSIPIVIVRDVTNGKARAYCYRHLAEIAYRDKRIIEALLRFFSEQQSRNTPFEVPRTEAA